MKSIKKLTGFAAVFLLLACMFYFVAGAKAQGKELINSRLCLCWI